MIATICDNHVMVTQTAARLDGLVKSLTNAVESGDGDTLYQLFYTENQPEDLSIMMKQQMTALVSNDSLELNEIRVLDFADHRPEPELPGELNGKKLKFLQPPSHWIIASMGGGDGGTNLSLDLTFPAREIDGAWKLLGSRYEEE
ncbi:hypothetical protein RMSM_02115 [Rhodopirellula maiorica SM1]|uniref:Uncharacterized protein n=1 Tax=Rhodopirellula maiorica SM1 TaxID=1265738 RepID=M5S446_9BACT|nr:hypothetical protein [Rhodopirellula maiorica]EMI20959.1 hypothetical protein RMSM_02115 [Rhodopirellula maiorica SM1]